MILLFVHMMMVHVQSSSAAAALPESDNNSAAEPRESEVHLSWWCYTRLRTDCSCSLLLLLYERIVACCVDAFKRKKRWCL